MLTKYLTHAGVWLLALCSAAVFAGTEYDYTLAKQSYGSSQARNYTVYVPDGLAPSSAMVMALHGCKQTENDVLNDWGMKAAADQYGFILVTPFITTYNGLRNENCWGFWFDEHRHEGAGEVEDLHQIGLAVEAQFSVDPYRRYITGLSSGGAMTVVAAVAHNEYWAAAASASGLPYGEDAASVSLSGSCPGSATFHSVSRVATDMSAELDDEYPIPMMVLQNEDDCTVVQPAGRNIRDGHLRVFGPDNFNTATEALAQTVSCSPFNVSNYRCQHQYFTANGTMNGRSLVETIFFSGPLATQNALDTDHGHYWIGGANGNEGKWAVKNGPVYPDIIWDFFNRHPKQGGQIINKPIISLMGDNPMTLNINDTFSDPGATATDVEDGSLTVQSNCNVDTAVASDDYSCSYFAQDSDGYTATKVRRVIVIDPTQPTESCIESSASPNAHISAGRASAGGAYNLRAISSGDTQDIGFAYDSWGSVTLTEGETGMWYSQQPEACRGTQPPPPPPASCTDWYATNLTHNSAGRAYYSFGYYAIGSGDSLGAISGSYVWISETSTGYFEAGQCPN